MSVKLTHFNEQGRARIVDISEKEVTSRSATAVTVVKMNGATLQAILGAALAKGMYSPLRRYLVLWQPRKLRI